jgi:flagellar assembly factor FliW
LESSSGFRYQFRHGIPAFELDREFSLIAEADWHPFLILESMRAGGPRFICVEIDAIEPGYSIALSQEDADTIGVPHGRCAAAESGLRLLGIIATADDGTLTANLAAPLLLDPKSGAGIQSIQTESAYSPFTVILRGEERQAC